MSKSLGNRQVKVRAHKTISKTLSRIMQEYGYGRRQIQCRFHLRIQAIHPTGVVKLLEEFIVCLCGLFQVLECYLSLLD